MARPRVADPLVPLRLRVPASLFEAITAEAMAAGRTTSDVVRARLQLSEATALGPPRSRKRPAKQLGQVSGADPALEREINILGSNLNQLARAVNTQAIAGTPMQAVEVLARLIDIERQAAQRAAALPQKPEAGGAH